MGLLENAESCVIVYPGQGGQKPGMGRRVIEHPQVDIQNIFDAAERFAGADIRRICLEGNDARGNTLTEHGQVAMVAILLAERVRVGSRLEGKKIKAKTGLSLGLWPAYVDAGVLTIENCLELVNKREAETLKNRNGAMVRVSSLKNRELFYLRALQGLDVAVKFSDQEATLVGDAGKVGKFISRSRDPQPVLLPIPTGYHWRQQEVARKVFKRFAEIRRFKDANSPVILNSTGKLALHRRQLRNEIIGQITRTANWGAVQDRIRNLGPDIVIEICDRPQLTILHDQLSKNDGLVYVASHKL